MCGCGPNTFYLDAGEESTRVGRKQIIARARMALPALTQLSPPSKHPSLLLTIASPAANIPCTTNSNNAYLSLKHVDQLFDETPQRADKPGV
ncbi:hypothetical protein AAC387_Pa06g2041 [Persea americana]